MATNHQAGRRFLQLPGPTSIPMRVAEATSAISASLQRWERRRPPKRCSNAPTFRTAPVASRRAIAALGGRPAPADRACVA